jgi:predicted short-subunit dehydrogenase-like oxidoreductase (DUF2520 family)
MEPNLKVSIIGTGRLGGALAIALSKKGYQIRELVSRRSGTARKIAGFIPSKPEVLSANQFEEITSEIVFITTPDPEIQTTAENLSEKLNHKPFVFHCSGALSSEILGSLRNRGCPTGSLHPLVSISDPQLGAERFKNAYFCLEGDRAATAAARKIVLDLEGASFSLAAEFKTLYHAAAVMASGHLVALFSAAAETLSACGVTNEEARKILFPLVNSTLENLSTQSPSEALTGTFARADVTALERHLEALRENVTEEVFMVYLQLGMRSLHLAEQQGADAENLAEMRNLLLKKGRRKKRQT